MPEELPIVPGETTSSQLEPLSGRRDNLERQLNDFLMYQANWETASSAPTLMFPQEEGSEE